MARGYDRQFTQLYQIDPSAYEGPSTFEGLADLVSVINQSTAQQEEKKRNEVHFIFVEFQIFNSIIVKIHHISRVLMQS